MTKLKRLLASIVLMGIVTMIGISGSGIFAPSVAHACSCAEKPAVLEQKDNKDAIFSGKAVSIKTKGSSIIRSSSEPVEVVFEVKEVWKGHVTPKLTVYTALDGASCGIDFQEGADYLVYAYSSEGKLNAEVCSRTTLLTNASEDLTILGGGSIPPQYQQLQQQSSSFWLIIGVTSVVLLVGIVLFFLLRRRTVKPLK